MPEVLTEWLVLREPVDAVARSSALARAVAALFPRDHPLNVLDLGTGTGSNVRYLADFFPETQDWRLVDRDPALLAEGARLLTVWGEFQSLQYHIEAREYDVGTFDHPEIFASRDLVTASALLDLVSEPWLRSLAARCRAISAPALFAMTYNGRSTCDPAEPEDEIVRDLFNRHQRNNDKGFGRASGPDAIDVAERCFVEAGYTVRRAPSDWHLAMDQPQLQRLLMEGWASAAIEVAPDQAPMIRDWLHRRLTHLYAGRSRLTVNHEDLAAWVP